MNCNDCVKRMDCLWLRKTMEALNGLSYIGRYEKASLISDQIKAWLPEVCRGFVGDAEDEKQTA